MAAPLFRIFISSPGDVRGEREVTRTVIQRVNARLGGRLRLCGLSAFEIGSDGAKRKIEAEMPFYWEQMPMLANRGSFQAQIPEPADFDLVICILWARLGSPLDPEQHRREDGRPYDSGTEYEFESALRAFQAAGRPELLVYRRTKTPFISVHSSKQVLQELEQWERLNDFCNRVFRDKASGVYFTKGYRSYAELDEFERELEGDLLSLARARLASHLPAPVAPLAPTWTQGSPYRGLRTFEAEHEAVFFGRTRVRGEVLNALRARWAEARCPFALIFGASGSGKSSLLRAGVLPWLIQPGFIEGIDLWRCLVWRPSDTPAEMDLIQGLAQALLNEGALPELGAGGTDAKALAAVLGKGSESIDPLLKSAISQAAAGAERGGRPARPPAVRLALGLDQLEEAFTITERFSAEGRALFFRAVAALARSGYVWIIATLRSDFFNRCEEHPELVALKQGQGQYHLLAPGAAELSQMIRFPAEAAGVSFEDHPEKGRLEDLLRSEALAPGALPLLEYTLDELYRVGADRGMLTHADYESLGGVSGALASRTEEAFMTLPEQARTSLDGVLRQLVRLVEGDEEVVARRNGSYAALVVIPGAKELIGEFFGARLLVGDQSASGERTVTLAHEALLHSWPRAAEWVTANLAFLRVRARVEAAFARWDASGRDPDFLLPVGRPLTEGDELMRTHGETLGAGERELILASKAREEGARKRRLRLRAALAALIATFLALAGWQWREVGLAKQREEGESKRARSAKEVADKLAREAQERERAVAAQVKAQRGEESDRDLATGITLHRAGRADEALAYFGRALKVNASNEPAAWWMWSALVSGKGRRRPLTKPREILSHSEDGKLIIAAVGGEVRLFEARTGKTQGEPMILEGEVRSATFSPDGSIVATSSVGGIVQFWNAQTGRPLSKPLRHDEEVKGVEFNRDGRLSLTKSGNAPRSWQLREARLWDAHSGTMVGEPLRHKNDLERAHFSPDGKYVLTVGKEADGQQEMQLWDTRSGLPLREKRKAVGSLDVRFSPSGQWLVLVIRDDDKLGNDVILMDPLSGKEWNLLHYVGENHPVVTFSRNGRWLAVGNGREVRIRDVQSQKLQGQPLQDESPISYAEFSQDDKLVLTSSGRTVRIWEVQTGRPVGAPLSSEKGITQARFSPDGTMVLVQSGSIFGWGEPREPGEVRAWDVLSRKPISEAIRLPAGAAPADFSADGLWIIASGSDDSIRIWETLTSKAVGEPFHGEGPSVGSLNRDGDVLHALFGGPRRFTTRRWLAREEAPIGSPLVLRLAAPGSRFDGVCSPDGEKMLIGEGVGSNAVAVFELRTRRVLGTLTHDNDYIQHAQFSADGKLLVTCGRKSVCAWDVATGKLVGQPLKLGKGRFAGAMLSPDASLIVTASTDNKARIWSTQSGAQLGEAMPHEKLTSATISPDGRWILTRSDRKTGFMRFWETRTGRPAGEPIRIEGTLKTATFSPDSRWLLTSGGESRKLAQARLWAVPSGASVGEAISQDKATFEIAFNADSRLFIASTGEAQVQVHDVQTARPIGLPLKHDARVSSAKFSRDGQRVVTGSEDKTARVWEAATGRPITPFLWHDGAVTSVSFSPDGSQVVTASRADFGGPKGNARLWDARTGIELGDPLSDEMGPGFGSTFSAEFSPDGRSILTRVNLIEMAIARVWPRPPALGPAPPEILAFAEGLSGFSFGPDGRLVALTDPRRDEALESSAGDGDKLGDGAWRELLNWAREKNTIWPGSATTWPEAAQFERLVGTRDCILRALRMDPLAPLARTGLAFFEQNPVRAEALRQYDFDRLPADELLCLEAARDFGNQSAWSLSARAAEKALAVAPSSAPARIALAGSYMKLGRHADVLRAVEPLLRQEGSVDANVLALLAGGELKDAVRVRSLFQEADRKHPRNMEIHQAYAIALRTLGSYAAAIDAFERAEEYCGKAGIPDGLLCGRALTEWMANRKDQAVETATRLIEANTEYAQPGTFPRCDL